MAGYVVKSLEDIPELDDGRSPFRPLRHHLGIRAFGVNSWTGHAAGDRIVNETGLGAHEELCLAGRTADALDHLRQAVERSERMRMLAREDDDLAALRGDPAFDALVAPPS
jgi:hypothetical protein